MAQHDDGCSRRWAILGLGEIATEGRRRVEEADETATALGYKHDTKQVDKQRYPNHSAAQTCANCAMYQGGAADGWAGCAMFGRKHIAAAGWCQAWVKKPG